MINPMQPAEWERVLKLARDGVTIQAIGARLGFSYDRIRSFIKRAEDRGDLPAGTLRRCCHKAR